MIHPSYVPILALSLQLASALPAGRAGDAAKRPAPDEVGDPPGTVEVEGGRGMIGLDVEEAERLIAEHRDLAGPIAGQTPMYEERAIPTYFLGVTECTNEQYAVFVDATGAKPPLSWGMDAINAAQREYVTKVGLERKEALERGERFGEVPPFDRNAWWEENWSEHEWAVPEDQETHPVVNVDYEGAQNYVRWAGARLMTEVEYQYAGRGRTENARPWGDDWKHNEYAQTVESRRDRTMPVGSYPKGATESGIHDLIGSVWEWTSSPYVALHEDYEPIEVTVGKGNDKEVVQGFARWDPDSRVVVGGSYKETELAARLTTRLGAERFQSTDALGFRIAASAQPGLDVANTVMRTDLPPYVRPQGTIYAPEYTLAIDRWQRSEGTAEVPGYAVIEGHDHLLFTPVKEINAVSVSQVGDLSHEGGPVHLGFLSTTVPVIEPALEPGTYMIAWRGKGKARVLPSADDEAEGGEEGAAAEEEEPPIWSEDFDTLVVYDDAGQPLHAISGVELDADQFKPGSEDGDLKLVPGKPDEEGNVTHDVLRARFAAPARVGRKAFYFQLDLRIATGVVDNSWRFPE